ncbi:MAG: hypothetical protein JSW06_04605 [Thermoplasmatales archaeon]|nr:MAG: hypothetical protein JSW06_04605 [Thermoplasmatales archaeon]
MLKLKIKVGSYYELKLNDDHKVTFAVMYGFDSGKNKDAYALRMYANEKDFEFPIKKQLFDKWVDEERIEEITSDEALAHAI